MPFEDGYVLKRIVVSIMSFMSKWKVFSQICILIAFMVLAFLVQGIMGYFNLKAMKEVTATDFNGSVNNLITISGVNEEILKIRSEYLSALANLRTGLSLDLSSLLMRVQALQMLDPDPNTMGTVDQTVKEIEALLKQPVNQVNYEKLDSKLITTSMLLQSLQRKVRDSAINSMESGNSYTQRSLVVNLIFLIISVSLSFILGLTIAASISQPLKSIVAATNSLAVGDLSHNLEAQGTREIVEVVRGLNYAIGGLRQLVRGINEQSEMVLYAGKELTAASADSGKSATEVARAMEELARASSDQALQISQTVETVNQLAELVRKVSADTDRIATASEKVAQSAVLGQRVTKDVSIEINQVYKATKEVGAVITELNNSAQEIGEITSVIRRIAEQTTLLALNAAIEAARAGEHGKGFSVVATETGKLAEQSKEAAQMIENLVLQMQRRSEQAVETVREGIAKVESGKELTTKAAVTFENIFEVLRDVLAQIDNVANSARVMSVKNENVIHAIATIAAISEESMAGTQEVSATAEEQSAAAHQVASLADNLTKISEKLKRSIGVFHIREQHPFQ